MTDNSTGVPTAPPSTGAEQALPLIRDLVVKTEDAMHELQDMHAEYERRPDAQAGRVYLANWFPNAIRQFQVQVERLKRGLADPQYRAGGEFANSLRFYQSLGYAFDVDLSWSALDRALSDRLDPLHPLAVQIIQCERVRPL